MSDNNKIESVHTSIWLEEPEPDNAFATRAAYCHGYDVYGEMLGHARWVDMLYLLFQGEAPTGPQAALLEALALALANAGPRDAAVHAAMCAGVGGSTAAASLIAALAVGAGQYTGAREVFLAMEIWRDCACDLAKWQQRLHTVHEPVAGIWEAGDHAPGFDPHGTSTSKPVRQTLDCLANLSTGPRLGWLSANRSALEELSGRPLTLSGIAAATFADLGLSPAQGEMLHLLLRLPGAAAHALEQQQLGHKQFPFFKLDLQNDPQQAEP